MPRILIVGCGFLGLKTAQTFHGAGWNVTGLTFSEESAAALSEEPFIVKTGDVSSLESLREHLTDAPDAILHCASSGRGGAEAYRNVYRRGVANLMQTFPSAFLGFTSSTSVYPQIAGEWIDEETPAEPPGELGQILRQTEALVLQHHGVVARVAGIYGPGRSVLLRKFVSQEAIIEDGGERWINQVHRDDIATALLELFSQRAQGVFNVCDDHPMQQMEFYRQLSQCLKRPMPPEGPKAANRKRAWTSKRVSNAKLRALGWVPKYPSFFDALQKNSETVIS